MNYPIYTKLKYTPHTLIIKFISDTTGVVCVSTSSVFSVGYYSTTWTSPKNGDWVILNPLEVKALRLQENE